ncbi:hypothetical protein AZH53_00410 [Methanomicrobiaceae archaeon CYW5]|nr:hypothetical protein [Methanovulcanius yangii]
MFSRSRYAANEPSESPENFYARLRGNIPVMRKQGQPPQKDPSTFSRYFCDLCNDSFPLTDMKQCSLCGRWSCPSCWTEQYYVCNSCHGIIRLHTMATAPPRAGVKEESMLKEG